MSRDRAARWGADLRACPSLDVLNREFAGYMCAIFNRVGARLFSDPVEAVGLAQELTRAYEERRDEICGVSHAGVSSSV